MIRVLDPDPVPDTLQTDIDTKYFPIVLNEPDLSTHAFTHPLVERAIRKHARGRNAEKIRTEVLLALRSALSCEHRRFKVSTPRLNQTYDSRIREKIIDTINEISTVVITHSPWSSITRELLPEIAPAIPVRSQSSDSEVPLCHYEGWTESALQYRDCLSPLLPSDCYSSFEPIELNFEILLFRHIRWLELCSETQKWTAGYDDGRTAAGSAVLTSLEDVLLPETIDFRGMSHDQLARANYWLGKYISSGVSRHVTRSYGRLTHPLMFGTKQIRRAALLRGEPVAELDLHATYHCLLAAGMNPVERKEIVKVLQSGTFYSIFPQIPELKKEVQKQILFFVNFCSYRPLSDELHRLLPGYAGYVESVRRKYSRHKLAWTLMLRESQIFIDRLLNEFWQDGLRPVIPFHDALLVRRSDLEEASALATRVLTEELGFTPKINSKVF